MDQTEKQLRWAEEALHLFAIQLDEISDIVGAARQNVIYNTRGATAFEPAQPVTISGQVRGCGTIGLDSAGVSILDHATGDVLGTFTCNSLGNYSGTIGLVSLPESIDIVATPPGALSARYAASATVTTSTSGGGLSTVTIPPASGYHCTSGWSCVAPASDTLTLTDSIYGAFTLTNSGAHWTLATTINVAAVDNVFGCGAISGLNVTWTFNGTVLLIAFLVNNTSHCPTNSATGATLFTFTYDLNIADVTCPPSMSMTNKVPSSGIGTVSLKNLLYASAGSPAIPTATAILAE
jgi:hypothetical protein